MNILITYQIHFLLVVALYFLFYALFNEYGKLQLFKAPQKYVLKIFLKFLKTMFVTPVVNAGNRIYSRWHKEIKGIVIGSLTTPLIVIFIYIYFG